MRVLFAGTPTSAAAVLQRLLESDHHVAAVVSQPDRPAGRRRVLEPTAVAALAAAHGLELVQPQTLATAEFEQWLRAQDVDCAVVVAYGRLIPAHLLQVPRYGWVNLHFSLLPAWRGAAPVQHAILHGDEVTGACVFQIEQGMDTGPIFGCVTEPLAPTDTAGEVLLRLTASGTDLLLAVLDAMAVGTAAAAPQSSDGITFAPRVTTAMAQIDWTQPALALQRAVRAYAPKPGAWTTLDGNRVKLLGAPVLVPEMTLNSGDVVLAAGDVLVGTGSCALRLDLVQPAGKPAMPAAAWARGERALAGAHFR